MSNVSLDAHDPSETENLPNSNRRRFLTVATSVVGGVGVVGAAVPFIASWNPSIKAKAAGAVGARPGGLFAPTPQVGRSPFGAGAKKSSIFKTGERQSILGQKPGGAAAKDGGASVGTLGAAAKLGSIQTVKSTVPKIGALGAAKAAAAAKPAQAKASPFLKLTPGSSITPSFGAPKSLPVPAATASPTAGTTASPRAGGSFLQQPIFGQRNTTSFGLRPAGAGPAKATTGFSFGKSTTGGLIKFGAKTPAAVAKVGGNGGKAEGGKAPATGGAQGGKGGFGTKGGKGEKGAKADAKVVGIGGAGAKGGKGAARAARFARMPSGAGSPSTARTAKRSADAVDQASASDPNPAKRPQQEKAAEDADNE